MLMYMQGDLVLPELEERSHVWLEKIRLSRLKDFDGESARLRMRVAVTAMRYACCLMLCSYAEWLLKNLDHKRGSKPKWAHGCKTAIEFLKAHPKAVEQQLLQFQTEDMLDNYEVLADYILDNLEIHFKEKIEMAKSKLSYNSAERKRYGRNDLLFDKLPNTFTSEDARRVKGQDASDNSVRQMLKNWKNQGLIIQTETNKYEKVSHP